MAKKDGGYIAKRVVVPRKKAPTVAPINRGPGGIGGFLHSAVDAVGGVLHQVGELPVFGVPHVSASGTGAMRTSVAGPIKAKQVARFTGEASGVSGARRVLGGSRNPWDILDLASVVPGGKLVGLGAKSAKAGVKAISIGEKAAREAGDAFKIEGAVDAKSIADINSWVEKNKLANVAGSPSSKQLLSRKSAEDLALGGDGVWLRFDSEKLRTMPMRGLTGATRGIPRLKPGEAPKKGGVYFVGKGSSERGRDGWGGVDANRIHWIVDKDKDVTYIGDRGDMHGDILDALRNKYDIDISYGASGQGFLNMKDMTDEVWQGTEAGARLVPGSYGGEYTSTAKWLQYLSRNVGFGDDAVDWGDQLSQRGAMGAWGDGFQFAKGAVSDHTFRKITRSQLPSRPRLGMEGEVLDPFPPNMDVHTIGPDGRNVAAAARNNDYFSQQSQLITAGAKGDPHAYDRLVDLAEANGDNTTAHWAAQQATKLRRHGVLGRGSGRSKRQQDSVNAALRLLYPDSP